jgi:hypothetical protein
MCMFSNKIFMFYPLRLNSVLSRLFAHATIFFRIIHSIIIHHRDFDIFIKMFFNFSNVSKEALVYFKRFKKGKTNV